MPSIPKEKPEVYYQRFMDDPTDVAAVGRLFQWIEFYQDYADTCHAVVEDFRNPRGDLEEKIREWDTWGKLGEEEARTHSRRGIKLRLRECVKAVKQLVNKDKPVPICPECKMSIDPEACFCGVPKNDHKKRHRFRPKGCICSLIPRAKVDTREETQFTARDALDAVLNYRFEGEAEQTGNDLIKKRLNSREFVYRVFEMPYPSRINLFKDFELIRGSETNRDNDEIIGLALKRLRERPVAEQRDFLLRFDKYRERLEG